jgi:hypothetical protein
MLKEIHHATLPEQGWPWAWDDSNITDHAYAYERGNLMVSMLLATDGMAMTKAWVPWTPGRYPKMAAEDGKLCRFPNMSARRALADGKRSGFMLLG